MRPRKRLSTTVAVGTLVLVLGSGCSGVGDRRYFRVPSAAMEPTIHCAKPTEGCQGTANDRITVDTSVDSFRRGDIVVFHSPAAALEQCGATGTFVKRVIGLPGEQVGEHSGGVIYVNGKKLAEPYVASPFQDATIGAWHVPAGKFFVLGDNRGLSCDSRRWDRSRKRTSSAA